MLKDNFNLFIFTQLQVVIQQYQINGTDVTVSFEPQNEQTYQSFLFDLQDNNVEIWIVYKPLDEQLQWFINNKSNDYILIDYSYEKPLKFTILKVIKKKKEGEINE